MTNEAFFLCNGESINDINELKEKLPKLNQDVFDFHVNEQKNDFAVWIEKSLEKKMLAKKIRQSTKKEEMLKFLKKFSNIDEEAEKIKYYLEDKNKKTRKKVKKEKLENKITKQDMNKSLKMMKFREEEVKKEEQYLIDLKKVLETKINYNEMLMKKIASEREDLTKRREELVDQESRMIREAKNNEKIPSIEKRQLWEKEKSLDSLQRYLENKESDLKKLENSLKEEKSIKELRLSKKLQNLEIKIDDRKEKISKLKAEEKEIHTNIKKLVKQEKELKNKTTEKPLDPLKGKRFFKVRDSKEVREIKKLVKKVESYVKKKKIREAKDSYNMLIRKYDQIDDKHKHDLYDTVYSAYKKLS